jgi:predicted metal-dependent enzyme (double-stranded beta helix superfamily)
MSNQRMPLFQTFIDDLRAIWAREPDLQRRMEKARPLLEALVKSPEMNARSRQWPSTEGRKNLRFYIDPDYGFVVNAVVRVPGRTGSVHDHGNCWVLYAVLDGTESLERWERLDDGSRPDHAQVKMTSVTTGSQGKVDLVAPYDIHAEQGGPTRSAAIILRSQKTGEGTIMQRLYDPETGAVTERWGPTQIDYELIAG